MRLDRILLTLFLATFLLLAESFAQQARNETCDVPVVVTHYNNQLVRDLTSDDFLVLLGGVPKTVRSVSIDAGPKRIVLILDASSVIPDDQWRLETEMAENLVGNARPEDRFALSVIGAENVEASFMPSDEVVARLHRLERSQTTEKTYDALLAAARRLNPPQFGDTIFLFGHDADFGSAATFDHVREVMLRNKLRFYGISFTNLFARTPPRSDPNKPLPKGFALSKLQSLSTETGYPFSFFAVHDLNLPGQMPGFEGFLADLYAGIAEPYRLNISAIAAKGKTELDISVVDMEARKIGKYDIHYPHSLFACDAPLEKTLGPARQRH